ncbi:MAG TPA: peptidylprolyl isomerase [Burkholderiales bacterium]|nr:peptidylprolyl isomerase [Burkholderiales bacterium]
MRLDTLNNFLGRWCWIALVNACFIAPLSAAQTDAGTRKAVPLDRIVAVVNDDVITQYELNDHIQLIVSQLKKQGTPLPPQNVLERQLLERLIVDRVQLQYAKETGLRVDDTQLEKTLERIAENNKMSLQSMRETLERDGVNFNHFREEIRNEIILARLKEREVDNKVVVTDSEIANYLKSQAALGKEDEFNLAHILVMVPDQASPEQIQNKRARAELALEQIKKGADFGQIAVSFSDASDALQGGALGWRPAGRLPPLFLEALRSMQPGDVSSVLRSANGFHIIKLLDKRGKDATIEVQQSHVRHILIKTSELMSESEARTRLLNLKERLENGADFAELARVNSEDGSAAQGGDLGWIGPGDTVPEFERAMNALKIGQISDPVRSPFGWHLIEVLERRKQDVTHDRERLLARQALRARKADEAYEEWLRQLRDSAYVEYHLDDK